MMSEAMGEICAWRNSEGTQSVLGAAFPSDCWLDRHTTGSLVGTIACLTAFRCVSIIRFVEDCRLCGRPHFKMGNVG